MWIHCPDGTWLNAALITHWYGLSDEDGGWELCIFVQNGTEKPALSYYEPESVRRMQQALLRTVGDDAIIAELSCRSQAPASHRTPSPRCTVCGPRSVHRACPKRVRHRGCSSRSAASSRYALYTSAPYSCSS